MLDELNKLQHQKGFSQELNKAKAKLFYFSSIIIFVVIFKPSMTGFLGNFSIKVHNHPSLFTAALIAVLLWFIFRFLVVLANEHPQIDFLNKPQKAIWNISSIWGSNLANLEHAQHELSEITKTLSSYNIDPETITISDYIDFNCTPEKTSGIMDEQKEKNQKICDNLRRFTYVTASIPDLQIRLSNIRRLVYMDVVTPLILSTIALAVLLFEFNSISILLDANNTLK